MSLTIDYRAVVDDLLRRREHIAGELASIDTTVETISRLILRETIEAHTATNVDRPDAEAVGRPGHCVHAEAEHSRTDGERNLGSAPVGTERDTRSPATSSVQNRQVADSESRRVDQLDVRSGAASTKEGVSVARVAADEAAPSSGLRVARLSPDERCEIGERVRELRRANRMTQDDLGVVLGYTGSLIAKVEHAHPDVSDAAMRRCEAWANGEEVPPRESSTAKLNREGAMPKPAAPNHGESRRRAASAIRTARQSRGLSLDEAAAQIGIDVDALDGIERAHTYADACAVKRAVLWAQEA